ncbi:Ribonuclease H-like domain [Cinara cedri]|uniref:Ribonuclease H-like domain n=1 Tax=Cinara cedri TaxID=506608 RepID=A0A5E4N787_9HEMI|nr:Ribonuclease H-like domain [Cinara cedri]
MEPKNSQPTVKSGEGSVMVWGCMSAQGVGNLQFIDGIMNQYIYLNILKTNLAASTEKMGIKDDFIFTQDNDPKHTAKKVKAWLLNNVTEYLVTPPQSPDINPTESLWDCLGRKIQDHNISSKETLKKTLEEEWNKITAETTRHLVDSMSKSCLNNNRGKSVLNKFNQTTIQNQFSFASIHH